MKIFATIILVLGIIFGGYTAYTNYEEASECTSYYERDERIIYEAKAITGLEVILSSIIIYLIMSGIAICKETAIENGNKLNEILNKLNENSDDIEMKEIQFKLNQIYYDLESVKSLTENISNKE